MQVDGRISLELASHELVAFHQSFVWWLRFLLWSQALYQAWLWVLDWSNQLHWQRVVSGRKQIFEIKILLLTCHWLLLFFQFFKLLSGAFGWSWAEADWVSCQAYVIFSYLSNCIFVNVLDFIQLQLGLLLVTHYALTWDFRRKQDTSILSLQNFFAQPTLRGPVHRISNWRNVYLKNCWIRFVDSRLSIILKQAFKRFHWIQVENRYSWFVTFHL